MKTIIVLCFIDLLSTESGTVHWEQQIVQGHLLKEDKYEMLVDFSHSRQANEWFISTPLDKPLFMDKSACKRKGSK